MRRIKLTVASIRSSCHPPRPDEISASGKPLRERTYWDTQEPGFGLRVRPSRNGSGINASFILQRDLNGKPVKLTIGRFGAWTPEQARKRARELAVEIDRGMNPNAEKRRARAPKVTLGEAVEMHIEDMQARERSPVSIKLVRNETRKYLADWLGKPLVDITGLDCRRRHRRLTEDHGAYIANHVLRHVRACWNTAARVYLDIPRENPTRAVAFNRERPRNNPIQWTELPAWWNAIQKLAKPVRRDLQLFYLFTGLRRTDGKTIRWEHIDFENGTIHRPRPKGGVDRAFTVPVSKFVLGLLRRRHEENAALFVEGDGGWVFPTKNRAGEVAHVSEAVEQRYDEKGKKAPSLPSPHRLRHTFATAGHEALLRELDLKILMNHVLPSRGDVTHGYIHPSLDHLRGCVEKIAAFLLKKADGNEASDRAIT